MACQIQFLRWRLLRFFDEAMQQGHLASTRRKTHPGDPTALQPAADFPQVRLQLVNERHPERPAKLHQLDVLTDGFAIVGVKFFQSLAHRLAA
jgi:hypothetical protein